MENLHKLRHDVEEMREVARNQAVEIDKQQTRESEVMSQNIFGYASRSDEQLLEGLEGNGF